MFVYFFHHFFLSLGVCRNKTSDTQPSVPNKNCPMSQLSLKQAIQPKIDSIVFSAYFILSISLSMPFTFSIHQTIWPDQSWKLKIIILKWIFSMKLTYFNLNNVLEWVWKKARENKIKGYKSCRVCLCALFFSLFRCCHWNCCCLFLFTTFAVLLLIYLKV